MRTFLLALGSLCPLRSSAVRLASGNIRLASSSDACLERARSRRQDRELRIVGGDGMVAMTKGHVCGCHGKARDLRRRVMPTVPTAVLALLGLWAVPACDDGPLSPSANWTCDVTLTLAPSRFGSLSSPSGSGRGTGTGGTRDQALSAAYAQACAQLNLDNATAARCRAGDDFQVEGGSSGNVRLFSAVERSVSCRS